MLKCGFLLISPSQYPRVTWIFLFFFFPNVSLITGILILIKCFLPSIFLALGTLFSFWHVYFHSPWLSFYHELLSPFILSFTLITKVASVSFWYLHHLLTVLFYLLSIWYQIISTHFFNGFNLLLLENSCFTGLC